MDTDSNYMGERLEDVVRPELRDTFEAEKKRVACVGQVEQPHPGLFKLECEGSRMIALCSKCYYVEETDGEKKAKREGDVEDAEHFHVAAF